MTKRLLPPMARCKEEAFGECESDDVLRQRMRAAYAYTVRYRQRVLVK